MPDTLSINEFAAKIKERRPDLASMDDGTLVGKLLAAEPSLKPLVRMEYSDQRGAEFQSPRYTGTGATPGQVAQDQAANVVRGVPEAITGIPAAVEGLGSLAWKALKGENINRESGQMVEGMVKPFQTSLEGATELYAPGSMGPEVAPESPEWAQAARSGGTMLAGAELPNALSGAKVALNPVFQRMKGLAPTPENLMQRAATNRMAAETATTVPSGVPTTKTGVVVNAARRVAAPVRKAIARVEETAARRLSGDANRPLVQGAPEVGADQFTPEVMNRTPPPDAPAVPPVEGAGRGIPRYDPYAPTGTRSGLTPGELETGAGLKNPLPAPTAASSPVTSADLNKWMNVRENQLLYGKNPGGRILQENLLGPDKPTTLTNVSTARKSVGSQMDDAFKRAESQGVRFELESDIRAAIADAKKTIGKSTDESFMRSIEGVESEIVSRMDDLKSVAPSAAHELEVELGRGVKWTGASSDVQRLLKDIRGRISRKLKTIEGIVPLKERWGDLFEAEQALKSSIRKDAIGRGTGTVFDRLKGQ